MKSEVTTAPGQMVADGEVLHPYLCNPTATNLMPFVARYAGLILQTAAQRIGGWNPTVSTVACEVFARFVRNAPVTTKQQSFAPTLHVDTIKVAEDVLANRDFFDEGPDPGNRPDGLIVDARSALVNAILQEFPSEVNRSILHRLYGAKKDDNSTMATTALADLWERLSLLHRVRKEEWDVFLRSLVTFTVPSSFVELIACTVHERLDFRRPRMLESEIGLLARCLSEAKCYFEYGVGGSTHGCLIRTR